MRDPIYDIPLFEGIAEAELEWLIANSRDTRLAPGDFFSREGERVERFYIVLEGELQITRQVGGETTVLGTTPRGIIGGETWLLVDAPAQSTARAIMACRLMIFEQAAFRQIFAACPTVGARILQIAANRLAGFQSMVGQQEKMAALGKLAAGLAHELNNPAAAARRSVSELTALWPDLEALTARLGAAGFPAASLRGLRPERLPAGSLSPLERSDRESELAEWLAEQGLENGWELAPMFVAAGHTPASLAGLTEAHAGGQTALLLEWLGAALCAADYLDQAAKSTERISRLVNAVKHYTFMDQAPLQEVDVHEGLENTLTILDHKLGGVRVNRQYAPDLPRIDARGGELNQVWTNLIDNAIDALQGQGEITLITRPEHEFVMVEVADNGPGIPPEVLPRIWETFFTTKPAGQGNGLGLDLVYRIVRQHHGTIEAQSQPGHTRFIVRLPRNHAASQNGA